MNPMDTTLDPNRMEPPLSEKEMAVRDMFVGEYMKDFDAYRACIRMGFLSSFALDHAKTFMGDGYVLRKIAYLSAKPLEPSDGDRAEMLANLRWLAHNGSPASRTAATQRYMEAQGYVKRDGDGEEGKLAAIADILREFGRTAPA